MSEGGPLPPVDDPLLAATLAKVTSAAEELSTSAKAEPPKEEPKPEPPKVIAKPITDDPDEPIVPVPIVRAKPRRPPTEDDADDDRDDDAPKKKRNPTLLLTVILVALLTVGGGALAILGKLNVKHYYLACEPERVIAQQGRSFPPWGAKPLDGKQWAPIKIPPETECVARETDNPQELADWYRTILVDRAGTLLTAREVTAVDDAAGLLEQALLLARSDARRSEREDIERLQGDVDYWRASAKLRAASSALTDAAKQFDEAAAQRPRHVSDAAAWAQFVRQVASDLQAGPNGSHQSAFPPTPTGITPVEHVGAPIGTALPIDDGSAAPAAGSDQESGAPDAGVATGGVLL